MEHNISRYSSPRKGKPAPKCKTNRLKPVFIITGSVIGLLILAVVIIIVRYKFFVIPAFQDAADTDYIIGSKQVGAQNYYREVDINGIKAQLTLSVPEGVRYGITLVLRPYNSVTVNGKDYDIQVDLSVGSLPWEEIAFFNWSVPGGFNSVELDSNGDITNNNDWLSVYDLQFVREMNQFYKPLLDYAKAERKRIEDNY